MGRRCEDLAERLWPDDLQEVQDSFSGALGLPILFVHAAGRPLAACEDLSDFCRWFTRTVTLSRPCLECGRCEELERLAEADGETLRRSSLVHMCPLGLADAAAPVRAAGETLGYLVTAQVSLEGECVGLGPTQEEQPGEAEEGLAFLARLDRRSHAEMESAAAGISVLASVAGALGAARRRNLRLAERIREQSRWIQEHVTIDPVTGLANRRRFCAVLEAEVLRVRRYKRTLSVAVLDIEGFHSVNDEFGHDTGDAVLRSVAQCLASTVRQTDLVARVGGDEFALLFPETSRPEAMIALARVRGQINDLNASGELPAEVRLIMGVVDRSGEPEDFLDAAYHAAQQARAVPGLIG